MSVHVSIAGDESKVGHLKRLNLISIADTGLSLFESDLYMVDTFETAIQGCEFVSLVATPKQHNHNSQYKDTGEAAVAAISTILRFRELSGTVKRVIYTGSVTAASPLKEDGTGFKDSMGESCWTPLGLSYDHSQDREKAYTNSKTLSEKELLILNDREEARGFEVVSLACGLVSGSGGDMVVPQIPASIASLVSPVTGTKETYRRMRFLRALLGSVPLVHIQDVCEAHVFYMERASMAGRFLFAAANPARQEIVEYYAEKYPQLTVIKEVEGEGTSIPCSYTKLEDMGFKYKYSVEQILDESVECAKRRGVFDT